MFVKLLEQTQASLQSAEEKRNASIAELTAKNQKVKKTNAEKQFSAH